MAMRTGELKEYLGIVVDMEKNLFLLEQSREKLYNIIEDLSKPKLISDPEAPVAPPPPKKDSTASIVGTSLIAPLFAFGWWLIIPMGIIAFALYGANLGFLIPLVIILPFALFIWLGFSSNKDNEKNIRHSITRT